MISQVGPSRLLGSETQSCSALSLETFFDSASGFCCSFSPGVFLSLYSIQRSPLDAIPDISDPQIVIYVKWPRSPQLIESDVTAPLIRALVGSSDIQTIRRNDAHGVLLHLHHPGEFGESRARPATGDRPDQYDPSPTSRLMPASLWGRTQAVWAGSTNTHWWTKREDGTFESYEF
jgi:hypothetical protein